jgi:hypothetical protein
MQNTDIFLLSKAYGYLEKNIVECIRVISNEFHISNDEVIEILTSLIPKSLFLLTKIDETKTLYEQLTININGSKLIKPISLEDSDAFERIDNDPSNAKFIRFFQEKAHKRMFTSDIGVSNYKLHRTKDFNDYDDYYFSRGGIFEVVKNISVELGIKIDVKALTTKIYLGLFSKIADESNLYPLMGIVSINDSFPGKELYISMDNKYKGKGLGRIFLQKVCEILIFYVPVITMSIDIKNIPSLKIAKSSNFVPYGIEIEHGKKHILWSYLFPLTYQIYQIHIPNEKSESFREFYKTRTAKDIHTFEFVVDKKGELFEILDTANASNVKLTNAKLENLYDWKIV